MKTVFVEEHVAIDLTFEFTSAIRYNKTFLVNGTIANDTMYSCPDEGFACPGTTMDGDNVTNYETCGCPYTAWVECALNKTVTQNQKVNFVTCWDDQTIADKVQNATTLEAFARTCSAEASLDWSTVQDCHNSEQKSKLLWMAANKFMDKWPQYTVMGGPFHVPHVLIGNGDMEDMEEISLDSTDFAYFNQKICSLGVEMPACNLTHGNLTHVVV